MRRTIFVTRSAAQLREAAARVCERLSKDDGTLIIAAKRIRRLPLAGFLGKQKKVGK